MTTKRVLVAIAAVVVAAWPAAPAQRPATGQVKESRPSAGVRRWMRAMSLRDEVAQLVVASCFGEALNSRSSEYRKYVRWVKDLRLGGLTVINRVQNGSVRHAEPLAMAAFINRMQRLAKVPLIVAGDFERASSMRVDSNTKFPHNMAIAATGDLEASRFEGEVTAREARALGVQWVFAPVADVNNNPDNPIINIRSYGEDPQAVAANVRAYIEGARTDKRHPVLVTVKHFPGHGDTATDTHLGLATLQVDRARLEQVEFVPFRAAIASGVDAVMTAHMAAPALDSPNLPSTLSPAVLGVLRNDLGFEGLIVTDALDMQGVSKQWGSAEAAVMAIQAGVDVLLMPPNPEQAIDGVVKAVLAGKIDRARIRRSVARVLAAKLRVGLAARRTVDLEQVCDVMDSPETVEKVQQIADRSVTLVINERDVLPIGRTQGPCFLILSENRYSTSGRVFLEEIRKRLPKARATLLDPLTTGAEIEQAASDANSCDTAVVAAFVSVAAYRGSVALPGGFPKLMDSLLANGKPVVMIALGNPYLLRSYPGVSAYLATYSTVAPSEIAAAKAVLGEIPISGRLPVTIPGLAAKGEGIQLPARPAL